eukprot:595022-Pleurochrysis_carterae.AAC.2
MFSWKQSRSFSGPAPPFLATNAIVSCLEPKTTQGQNVRARSSARLALSRLPRQKLGAGRRWRRRRDGERARR